MAIPDQGPSDGNPPNPASRPSKRQAAIAATQAIPFYRWTADEPSSLLIESDESNKDRGQEDADSEDEAERQLDDEEYLVSDDEDSLFDINDFLHYAAEIQDLQDDVEERQFSGPSTIQFELIEDDEFVPVDPEDEEEEESGDDEQPPSEYGTRNQHRKRLAPEDHRRAKKQKLKS